MGYLTNTGGKLVPLKRAKPCYKPKQLPCENGGSKTE